MRKSSLSRRDFFKLAGGVAGVGMISYYLGLRNYPKPAVPADAPDYLDAGSAFPVFRGPYLQKDAQLAAFLFPADLDALTSLCAKTLNAVPNSPFEYIPLMPNLLAIYADMLVSSLDERDAGVGLIPETEVGFWFLTVTMQKTASGAVPHHLVWSIPYLLVDEGNAIATGREVYGFNKQAASFGKAVNIQSPQFSADVLSFQSFASDAIAQKQRLLDLSSPSAPTSQSQWADWETAQSALADMLLPRVRTDLGAGIVAFAAQTALKNIPLVFLKQFRHAAEPQKACYQSIVEAPVQLTTFRGGGFFNQSHEMTVHPLASHPLAERLGLRQYQASTAGSWMKMDFLLGLGREYQFG